jgi:hypothetical protein
MKKREEDQLYIYISMTLSDQTYKQSKINTQF